MKKIISLFLSLTFVLILIFILFSTNSNYEILVIGDYSEEHSGIGKSVREGAEYAINNLGKELSPGKTINIRSVNDRGDHLKSRELALDNSLKSNVIAVIGHTTSGNTTSALDIYGSSRA